MSGKMERSRLTRCLGWRYALMDLILEDLMWKAALRGPFGKHDELISLKD